MTVKALALFSTLKQNKKNKKPNKNSIANQYLINHNTDNESEDERKERRKKKRVKIESLKWFCLKRQGREERDHRGKLERVRELGNLRRSENGDVD